MSSSDLQLSFEALIDMVILNKTEGKKISLSCVSWDSSVNWLPTSWVNRVQFLSAATIFLFVTMSRWVLTATQPSVQWLPWDLSLEIMWLEHETDYSFPSTLVPKLRMNGALPPRSLYPFTVWCLVTGAILPFVNNIIYDAMQCSTSTIYYFI
jgi:hypothetical protein